MANQQLMLIFAEFGRIKLEDPESEKAQKLVKKLQEFIIENFFDCSKETLKGLGKN